MYVEEEVQAKGLSFIHDLRWVATMKSLNYVVKKLEACTAESIEWASRQDLEFDTAQSDVALGKWACETPSNSS